MSRSGFYEYRPGQVRMAQAVWDAFTSGKILLAEAGTGTGKSLAYLLPSAWLGHRVVISTGTKALQEQLLQKDIPLMESLVGRAVKTVAMKGRANYLCLHYYRLFKAQPLLDSPAEARFLDPLEEWASRTATGDRAEWEGIPEDLSVWREINARGERCLGGQCPLYDSCFIVRLRCEAEAADLVVVNHHLLFADLALKKRWDVTALPSYAYLVLDEAHEAEDAAISFFGVSVSKRGFSELCRDIEKAMSRMELKAPARAAQTALKGGVPFFDSFGHEAKREVFSGRALGPAQQGGRDSLEKALATLSLALASAPSGPELAGLTERLEGFKENLEFSLREGDEDFVKWLEVRSGNTLLGASPIEVGELLSEGLFGNLRSALLTSATLTVRRSFKYLRSSLGVPAEASELAIESPFDYARQGLMFIPDRFPEPASPEFLPAFLEAAVELIRASRGRAFVLCTSYRNMEAAASHLAGACPYRLLVQGSEPKGLLLKRFREAGDAVLVATASFWQGVDVQGEALSLVVLDKIPFAVPSDPVPSARIRLLKARGGDPFNEYQLPQAAILIKQGVGRLIRSSTDRGVVACTDIRLRTKSYGRALIESLPPFPITGDLREVERFF